VVLGIGSDNLISVPVDKKGQMNVELLQVHIQNCRQEGHIPLAVVATAGTTVLGAFDDIRKISQVCQSNDVWLHIDAAWGGPVLFSKKWRSLMEGVELADSLTFDAHKLLGASLTNSFFLTPHRDILLKANDVSGGDYLFHRENGVDRGKLSWQCGRKAEAVSFWTLWKNVGTQGFGDFVERMMDLRGQIVDWIQTQPRLQLVAEPDYLNICVRVLPPASRRDPDWSRKVRDSLKENNLALVNYSKNNEGSFLRLILANPYLQVSHVVQILKWSMEVSGK
jgi:glutamate/tyrosine decarboxylase-like PLP-dependent enzyme